MLYLSIAFLVLALVAWVLGFGVVAFAAAGIAKVLFIIFLVLFVVSFLFRFARTADDVVDRNLQNS